MSQRYVFLLGRRDSHLLPLSSPAPLPPSRGDRLLPCGLTSSAPLPPSPYRLLPGGFDAKCTVDSAVACCNQIGNMLADIHKCRLQTGKTAGHGGPSAMPVGPVSGEMGEAGGLGLV